jgi:transposase-like protein
MDRGADPEPQNFSRVSFKALGQGEGAAHSVDDQPDAASVHAQFDRIVDALADKLPKVAEHLDAARADILAFTAFPKELWRQIWSNNPKGTGQVGQVVESFVRWRRCLPR